MEVDYCLGNIYKRKPHFSLAIAMLIAWCTFGSLVSSAQDTTKSIPQRPKMLPNRRGDEDWSVLADTLVKREPLDGLKYMPFSIDHPHTYLSLGINVRERLESDHAPFLGTVPGLGGVWLLSRMETNADLRLGDHVQIFIQLQSAFAPGKQVLFPVDQDRLDIEQAFIGLTEPLGNGTLKMRLGRQLVGIDFQRFVSVRDGPNLRQSYDAAYADYQWRAWRVSGGYTQPVQIRDQRAFDGYSNNRLTLSGVRVQRLLFGSAHLTGFYIHYTNRDAAYTSVTGNERREVMDIRFNGIASGLDWDIEGMNQFGKIAHQLIRAWAFGSLVGYTFAHVHWTPRLGLSVDFATGDRNPHDNTLETFNPLFPNGYYLADYTGFPNLIHIKPAVTVHPVPGMNLMIALASQWRETTADAVYAFPGFPLANTAGRPGSYSGMYGELREDWTITSHYSVTVDAVYYAIGNSIRQAGGHDSNYLSLEIRYGW